MKHNMKLINNYFFYDIKIPPEYKRRPPKPQKLIDKMLKFNRESELDDIIIDEDFTLIDGYCSYLIAKQAGVCFATIKQVRCKDV